MPKHLAEQYRDLKKLAHENLAGDAVARLISEMALYARALLKQAKRVELVSKVESKRYFSFKGEAQSRPINEDLYVMDDEVFKPLLREFLEGFRNTKAEDIIRGTYTIAYSVFAANDVYAVGRKASATFFEVLIGHIIARLLGISPRRKVRIPESDSDLPTDYVFDPGRNSRKIHLPIKTSTRERAVQAWVHQLVLDRIFGNRQYHGILVVASETKRNARTGRVDEICVPNQLQMFQTRVAEISRVYYLDPPAVYLALAHSHSHIEVRPFSDVFNELRGMLRN